MRVLYFSLDYTPHDHRFLTAMSETEYEVHYLRLENARALEKRPLPESIRKVDCWEDQRSVGLIDAPRLLVDLRRVLQQVQPDLVHAGPVQRCALLTALTDFHPLVTMSWGSDLLMEARRGPGRWAARYALSRSDVFVCDCQTVRKAAMQLGMSDERVVVFPWGVDLAHFAPGDDGGLRARLGWEGAFILLSTRAWEPIYGIELLIFSFIDAIKIHPDLRLMMLSQGSLQSRVMNMLREAGIQDRVHFAGHVGYTELPMYYRSADLYVSTSHSDGSSVSLMESLACGCPVLVSDIPGNREWITPEEQGWWFADSEICKLTDGIMHAVRNRGSLPAMGRAARTLAEQRADWRQNYQLLLKAYKLAMTK